MESAQFQEWVKKEITGKAHEIVLKSITFQSASNKSHTYLLEVTPPSTAIDDE